MIINFYQIENENKTIFASGDFTAFIYKEHSLITKFNGEWFTVIAKFRIRTSNLKLLPKPYTFLTPKHIKSIDNDLNNHW